MMKITGAIFDMDGTLIDSLMIWDELWEHLGREFLHKEGFRPSLEDDKAVRTMTLLDAMTFIHERYSIDTSGESLCQHVTDYLEKFYRETVKPKKGAAEFLEILHSSGVKMCIASATASDQVEIALERCGIRKYFSALVSCKDVGKGKEHPDVFFKALEVLGTDIETTWVFEDSATALMTASKAGFKTVGIYDRYNFGHDIARSVSDVYVEEGETLEKIGVEL